VERNPAAVDGNPMIQNHFAAIEKSILELAKIQDIAGHAIHKGTPREIFIKNFLENHLGKTVSYGTGEIIDADSKPRESRNQHDIVIYRNEFPKLDFQGEITAFLAESVLATIEVKSKLDYRGLKSAFTSAIVCKNLNRNYWEGLKLWNYPPKILNYIVTYNGPKHMRKIYEWIKKLEEDVKFEYPEMPLNKQDRMSIASPGIDGIFILGKGFVHFDNFAVDCVNPELRQNNPWMRWILADMETASLLLLFLNLAQAICSYSQKAVKLIPYTREVIGYLQWAK
jgi:hypothetical protein